MAGLEALAYVGQVFARLQEAAIVPKITKAMSALFFIGIVFDYNLLQM
jgi:hypothetical protein